ncbi:hypothetical protein WBG78_28250 [Chryseolinea sp. T2]|uniref:hypothetical protein n=1 Tax=Chryseolinea sp. T2 TaxID=3129255 RepID=UPI003077E4E7
MKVKLKVALISLLLPFASVSLRAQEKPAESAQEMADKLANPVASMISLPFQNNTDWGIGAYSGSKNTLNIQPVIPIKINAKLNLITRYILPVVDQRNVTEFNTHQFGLSDLTASAWFSPAQPKNGLIWGAGPALLVPTATNEYLGTKKFGVGPTALLLKQTHGMTFGFLVNQIWSIAGDEDRQDINQLFVQPFFARTFASGASIGGNMELTQNWQNSTTLLFFNPTLSAITKIGKQPMQLVLGPRVPLSGPDSTKPKFGIRAVLIFIFAE